MNQEPSNNVRIISKSQDTEVSEIHSSVFGNYLCIERKNPSFIPYERNGLRCVHAVPLYDGGFLFYYEIH